jgi:hypothetical protein
MTAPVVRKEGMMQFILPARYDSLEKAPKPTDATVFLKEIPPSVGVVKYYSGPRDFDLCRNWALSMGQQLREDGVDLSEDYFMHFYQFWNYDPPSVPSSLRRNEVWIPLTPEQAATIVASHGREQTSSN